MLFKTFGDPSYPTVLLSHGAGLSWWSYRAADFRKSNRGLRLDHILVTPGLKDAAFHTGKAASRVHDDVREWERPSDHAPVSADFAV